MNRKPRLKVRGPEGPRPFLRGMLAHSLLRHGLSFDEALAIANLARDRLIKLAESSGKDLDISTGELRRFVLRLVEEQYGDDRAHALHSQPPPAEPTILHPKGGVPFSRGLLSQKIAGTGLDPRQAYEVANDVWLELTTLPRADISEPALHALERHALVARHGETFGLRYDAIGMIQRSTKPIVILIGGTTGCGKSTLAMELAYRLGIRKVASTDMIREIMRKLLSPDILPSLHTSPYRVRTHADDPVLSGFLEQAARVEVGITASIRRAVLENFHLIVEGVHIVTPEMIVSEFADKAYVVPVILATLDRHVLESRFVRRGKEQGRKRQAQRHLNSLDDIMRIQEVIVDHADQNDIAIIQNVSFDDATRELLGTITDQLHRMIQSDVGAATGT